VLEDPGLLEKYPPIVSVDSPDMPGHRVLIDTENAAYEIAKHLLAHQYKRIGLIIPPLEAPNVVPFYQGYQLALKEAGLEVDPNLIAGVEGFFDVHGREGAQQLLTLEQPPDAILAASDTLALGAMKAIRHQGLEIPGDIALAGYNDIQAASLVQPALTTASIQAGEMGTLAVNLLQSLIEGKLPKPKITNIATHLVIRESCGCN
jgi:DNA-binding LacI/PurR family transcriptional regulator